MLDTMLQPKKYAILTDASDTITIGENQIDNDTSDAIMEVIENGIHLCVVTGCSESIIRQMFSPLQNRDLESLGSSFEIPVYVEHGTRAFGMVNGYSRKPHEILAFKRGNGHEEAHKEVEELLLRSKIIKDELCDIVECENPRRVYQDNAEMEYGSIREQLKITYSMSFGALSDGFTRAADKFGFDLEPPFEEWGDITKFNPSYWNLFSNSVKLQAPELADKIILEAKKILKKESNELSEIVKSKIDSLGYNDTHKVESYTTAVDILPIGLTKGTAASYELDRLGNLEGVEVITMGDSVSDLEMNPNGPMLIPKGSTLEKQGYGQRENIYVVEGGVGAPMFKAAMDFFTQKSY